MKNLAIVYELLVRPSLGVRAASEKRSIALVLWIILFFSASVSVADLLIFSSPGLTFSLISLTWGGIFYFFFALIGLFLLSCILHFIAEGLSGEGKVLNFFVALGCSLLPGILTAPLSLILSAIGSLSLKTALYLISKMIIFYWVATLQILAIKEVYHLSSGRALLTYLIPPLGILFLFSTLLALLILTIVMGIIGVF